MVGATLSPGHNQGQIRSSNTLGVCLTMGDGIEKGEPSPKKLAYPHSITVRPADVKRGQAAYLKAAEGGDTTAQYNLGCSHLNGTTEDADMAKGLAYRFDCAPCSFSVLSHPPNTHTHTYTHKLYKYTHIIYMYIYHTDFRHL